MAKSKKNQQISQEAENINDVKAQAHGEAADTALETAVQIDTALETAIETDLASQGAIKEDATPPGAAHADKVLKSAPLTDGTLEDASKADETSDSADGCDIAENTESKDVVVEGAEKGTDVGVAGGDENSQESKKRSKTKADLAPDAGMLKLALKNFFKNLAYVFVPMGTVYLFFLIAILLFASSTFKNLSGAINDLVNLIGTSIDESSASVTEFLKFAFGKINWNGNFFEILSKLLDFKWISETVRGFFATLSASSETFDAELNAIVSAMSATLKADLSVSIAIAAIGIWLANFFTRLLIRHNTAKRTLKKTIIAHTVVPVLQSVVVVVASVLVAFIKWFSLLVFIVSVVAWAAFSLLSAWAIHKDGTVSLKQILTRKAIITQILVGLIVLAIDFALFVALWYINRVLCVLIMIPFFIYSLNIIDINCDSYVCQYIKNNGGKQESSAEVQEAAA